MTGVGGIVLMQGEGLTQYISGVIYIEVYNLTLTLTLTLNVEP